MEYTDVLATAQKTAEQLGIKIKNTELVLKNMKHKIGVTTILQNEGFILWIDKHYIAYNEKTEPEIVYVFVDREHIGEELRSVIGRFKSEKSSYALKTLLSVKKQLHIAGTAMRESGDDVYFFDEVYSHSADENYENDNLFTMTLCGVCRSRFGNTGEYHIRRINRKQKHKEVCTYCNDGLGWDYKIKAKSETEGN